MRKLTIEEYARLEAACHEEPKGIEYNDEIISIDSVGPVEMYDIETSRHHIYFGNGIAVHNSTYGRDSKEVDNSTISDSLGTAMTADLLVMMLQTEAQKEKCEITFKITKNRYTGLTRTFNAKANYQLMRFEALESFDNAITEAVTNAVSGDMQSITSSDSSQISENNGVMKDFDWSSITG